MADDDVWNEVHPVVADEIHRLRDVCRRQQAEIERLRGLIDEYGAAQAQPWADLRSAPVADWNAAADRLNAAQRALILEARRD